MGSSEMQSSAAMHSLYLWRVRGNYERTPVLTGFLLSRRNSSFMCSENCYSLMLLTLSLALISSLNGCLRTPRAKMLSCRSAGPTALKNSRISSGCWWLLSIMNAYSSISDLWTCLGRLGSCPSDSSRRICLASYASRSSYYWRFRRWICSRSGDGSNLCYGIGGIFTSSYSWLPLVCSLEAYFDSLSSAADASGEPASYWLAGSFNLSVRFADWADVW